MSISNNEASSSRIIVAICTYNRAEPLKRLIESLLTNAERAPAGIEIGLTIVDDSLDGNAESIAAFYASRFALGISYLNTASGNISIARNAALDDASRRGDWIAMTDDDCEATEDWLMSLVSTQRRSGTEAATGLMLRRPGGPAPVWLTRQGFLALGEFAPQEGELLRTAFTNNCLIQSAWLLTNSDVRFDPELGKIGGEDMVFFGSAHARGLRIAFSKQAIVYEYEPPERLTFAYQIWRYYWHGNSSIITQLELGRSKLRMLVHACMSIARALSYSPSRMIKGQPPHARFGLALLAEAYGKLVGSLGWRVKHH